MERPSHMTRFETEEEAINTLVGLGIALTTAQVEATTDEGRERLVAMASVAKLISEAVSNHHEEGPIHIPVNQSELMMIGRAKIYFMEYTQSDAPEH